VTSGSGGDSGHGRLAEPSLPVSRFQPALDVCGGAGDLVPNSADQEQTLRFFRACLCLSHFFSFLSFLCGRLTWDGPRTWRKYFTVPSLERGNFLDSFPLGNRFLTLVLYSVKVCNVEVQVGSFVLWATIW
jgi:hypothetical protein